MTFPVIESPPMMVTHRHRYGVTGISISDSYPSMLKFKNQDLINNNIHVNYNLSQPPSSSQV